MLLLACCVAAMLGFSGCGTSKINLRDYVEVTFEGYDADVSFDTEAIDEKYGNKLKLTDTVKSWGYSSV